MVGSGAQRSKVGDAARQIIEQPGEKMCLNCGTTKTPLWRRGPAGPKTLCNACGLRTKKDEVNLGPKKKTNKKRSRCGKKVSMQKRLNGLANLFLSHKSSKERCWKNLSIDDEAALTLMCLGS